ncbi:MAG: hypothetical protein EOO08_02745 [Chitinophagaceae bacterium]|nr:MAG: hypothetical protein EOO08_02745 [Chitinophagaceae bacterium]
MQYLFLLLGLAFSASAWAQSSRCLEGSPVPAALLSDADETKLTAWVDSFQRATGGSTSRIIEGDTTAKTRKEFKDLLRTLVASKMDAAIDSFSKYDLLFQQYSRWRTSPGQYAPSSNRYRLDKKDTAVVASAFYVQLGKVPGKPFGIQSYSYGHSYLVIKVCDEYIGENSWGRTTVYYLRKNN